MTQKYIVRLSAAERKMLFKLIQDGNGNKEKLNRARILHSTLIILIIDIHLFYGQYLPPL